MPIVAVTGATGAVGSQVVSRLAELGVDVRPVVRDRGRVPQPLLARTRQASGYGAFDEMRTALAGVHTLFLVPATEAADRVEQQRGAVDAAVSAGVGRIVYLSFLGAAADATFTLARDHWHTEQHVRATGLPWTFLRMNLYMDGLPLLVGEDDVIRGPAGSGRVSAVLRADVAAACSAVLASPGHDGRVYDLTGPESLTLAAVAALLSTPSRTVRYHDETDDEAWQSRRRFGAPDFAVRGWISSYQAIRDGSLQGLSPHVRELTGREPTAFADYLAASRA